MKEITMPKLSDTMTEGQFGVWLKSVGERIVKGDIIAEVETDKATMQLEAFASGVLLERFVEAGQVVPVGTVIGIIGEAGEKSSGENISEQPAPAIVKADAQQAGIPEPAGEIRSDRRTAGESVHHDGKSAPVVRRRALELGIDINKVQGSGPGGRVLLEDVEAFGGRQVAGGVNAAVSPAIVEATVKPPAEESPEQPAVPEISRDGEIQTLSRMRSAIAKTVDESWRTIPHFTVMNDIRMDKAEEIRRELKSSGMEISYDDMIVKASALAVQKYPLVNASFADGGVRMNNEVNIGVMVHVPDGLLVPVVKGVQSLSLREISEKLRRLIDNAQTGTISPLDFTGGTLSISNMGMFDVKQFTAIILPHQSAILAIGTVEDIMVISDGQPLVARVMTVTISADHRVLDGVYAAEFLRELKQVLENPVQLLL